MVVVHTIGKCSLGTLGAVPHCERRRVLSCASFTTTLVVAVVVEVIITPRGGLVAVVVAIVLTMSGGT
jgi:hypothetical protein